MICKLNPNYFVISGIYYKSKSENWEDSHLNLNNLYDVYGLGIYCNIMKILIDPKNNSNPIWYSLDHFVIFDDKISDNWRIHIDYNDDWSFLFGYELLVKSKEHFNGILERNDKDLEIFAKFKMS